MVTWKGDAAKEELRRRVAGLRQQIAQRLLEHAQAEVPVDTGALLESGYWADISATTSIVAFPLHYAHFVEFGTIRHGPNAFLRRAVSSTVTDARVILGAR